MFKQDYSLLSESHPLQNSNENSTKNKKQKRFCSVVSGLVLLLIVVFGIVYFVNYHYGFGFGLHNKNQQQSKDPKQAFPDYPSEEELAQYRSKVRVIEYSIKDLEDKSLLMNPESDKMQEFHSKLIDKHGYNTEEHNVQFKITDDTAALSGLSCYTSYATSYSTGFYEATCATGYSTTGCISYEPYTNGNRWGETGYYTSSCYSWAYDTSYSSIWARCCEAYDSSKAISTSFSSGVTVGYDYCTGGDCDYGSTVVGCSATDSSSYSSDFTGVRRTERDYYSTFQYSGCNAQRSDGGYLWVSPYCAYTDSSSSLDCYTVSGDTSVFSDDGYSMSVVRCTDDNYELTGCSAYIDNEIASCVQPGYDDYGTNYGGWTYGNYCAARGDYGIVAQATCCQLS